MSARKISSIVREESAAAAVEFAIVLPLMLVLFAGFVEFGDMLLQQIYLEKAVRDSGRYLSQWSGDPTCTAGNDSSGTPCAGSPGTICSSGNPSTVAAAATNLVLYNSLCSATTPLISNLASSDVVITEPTSAISATVGKASENCTVPLYNVAITLPYNDPVGLLGFLNISSVTLTASHTERQAAQCSWS